jgi:hypothetical protein
VLREFRCENLIWTIPQLLQKLGVFVAQTQGSAPLHPGLNFSYAFGVLTQILLHVEPLPERLYSAKIS